MKGVAQIAGIPGSFEVDVSIMPDKPLVPCTIPFGVRVTVHSTEHPIDLYDRMTEGGYRLNLVDGRWYQPIVARYDFVTGVKKTPS